MMQRVTIAAAGRLREDWQRAACAEYAKRLTRFCTLNVIEIPERGLPANPSQREIAKALEQEGEELLSRAGGTLCALCVEGETLSSEGFARLVEENLKTGTPLTFLIGGSWGLGENVKAAAIRKISLSRMTLPHTLARVVLLEQLYRAFEILTGGKYHK